MMLMAATIVAKMNPFFIFVGFKFIMLTLSKIIYCIFYIPTLSTYVKVVK